MPPFTMPVNPFAPTATPGVTPNWAGVGRPNPPGGGEVPGFSGPNYERVPGAIQFMGQGGRSPVAPTNPSMAQNLGGTPGNGPALQPGVGMASAENLNRTFGQNTVPAPGSPGDPIERKSFPGGITGNASSAPNGQAGTGYAPPSYAGASNPSWYGR